MRTLATLGLAGLIAAGSLAGSTTPSDARNGARTGAFVAGAILGLGVAAAAASQHHYYGYDDYVAYDPYPGYYVSPGVTYVAPAPRRYYRSHCEQYFGYNPWTGIVTEANGNSWQCSPPRR